MLTEEFVLEMQAKLLYRRLSKQRVLQGGGEQALSHSYKDIARIDFALKRIKQGQYGLCTNCGCIIDTLRLRLIPEAPFCALCAQEIEAH